MEHLNDPANRGVEGIDLVNLLELPHGSLAMPPVARALVAVFAQGHACVLAMLLDVMGIAWAGLIANAARQLLDQVDVIPLLCVEGVVHDTALSIDLLDASKERQTSILA